MKRPTAILIILLYLLALPALAWYREEASVARFDPGQLGAVDRDVTYCEAGGVPLKMDIFHPESASGPAAAVLLIHGGGLTGGDKSDVENSQISLLTKAGFLVVAVNYRLAPQFLFPAPLEDVKCAVRYLRANSKQYDLDPARIGAMGRSSGGQLASLLGVTDADDALEGSGGYPFHSSRVEAVVDLFGPLDFTQDTGDGALDMRLITPAFGVRDRDEDILRIANPEAYITTDDPPFLIIHGEKDATVPPLQSQELYYRLQDAGVPARLVMVKNAGHELQQMGGEISPAPQEISKTIMDFLRTNLSNN